MTHTPLLEPNQYYDATGRIATSSRSRRRQFCHAAPVKTKPNQRGRATPEVFAWLSQTRAASHAAGLSKRRPGRVSQKAVQRRHDLRALPDRAAHPLDRAGAHVADGEHAGHRGFELRSRTADIEVRLRAGDDEAGAVERDAA